MVFRRPFFFSFLFLLIAVAQGAAPEAFPGLNRKWKYYQSPNFELYSCRSDAASRDLLGRMELLRALFIDTFKLTVRLPQPVTIFAFQAQKEFNAYLAPERRGKVEWAGFCYAQPDRTTITLAPSDSDEDLGKVVYHEYIHCLFHMTEKNPPPWFNEGVAELFSTMTEENGWLNFGLPIPGRVHELKTRKLMPLADLFAVTYDSPVFQSAHTGLFYSESWALMHYLQFGVNKIPPEKVTLFLKLGESAETQGKPGQFRAAAKELLGADYPQLERDLARYAESGVYKGRKVRKPEIPAKSTYTTRLPPPDEMSARLAELSLRFTRSGYANLAVRNQLERHPEARLQEVLGTVSLEENDPDRARERWLEAFELGTTNVAVFRELGRLESNLLFGQFDLSFRLPEDRAERLRRLLGKSIAEAPEQSNGYEMLAWVEAAAQKPDLATVNRIQARFGTLNNKQRTLLALALVRMRIGKNDEALEMLSDMEKLPPDDWAIYCAEITRADLEKRPVDLTKLPTLSARGPGMIMTPPKLDLPR